MDASDLLDLLRERYGSVKKANKGWVMIKCPSCTPKDARKMKRGVNLDTIATKCWICEEELTVKDLLGMEIERGKGRIIEDEPEHPQARIIPAEGVIPINELSREHPAVKLFLKDHLTDLDRYWNENHIGFITKEASHDIIYTHEDKADTKVNTGNSLIFPVYYNYELVGWQLRLIPGSPSFRYYHIFKKGEYLYNFDNAIRFKTVVVVEGVKKALKFPNGVATLGKGISESQIQKLTNWNNIIFLYDGEDDTQKKARELVAEISVGSKRCINIDPRWYNFDSPDDMPEDVAQKIVFAEWSKQTK